MSRLLNSNHAYLEHTSTFRGMEWCAWTWRNGDVHTVTTGANKQDVIDTCKLYSYIIVPIGRQ